MVDHAPWEGDSPYFLLIVSLEPNEGGSFGHLVLDVDRRGWQAEYRDWLERSAEWYLCEKAAPNRAVLAQIVFRGEHPYYLKRHIGQVRISDNAGRATVVHGIGKRVPAVYDTNGKRRKLVSPERTDRLWLLPGGVVCGGEDVEKLAMAVVQAMQWQSTPELAGALPAEVPSGVEQQGISSV